MCRSVTGKSCAASVYRSAVFELALALAAILTATTAAIVAWRYCRRVRHAQRQAGAHAAAARITGRALPGAGRAVVLEDPHPAAYCLPGRPAVIVITTAALAVLDPPQLAAVLAHERAHLVGRHHLLLTLTRGLAASFPAVPVFARGRGEVARLAELCADDAAARHSGRGTLLAALLTMGTGQAVPTAALAVTAGAVAARAHRLLEPACRGRRAGNGLALIAMTALLIAATGVVAAFAAPLAAFFVTLA